jgi:hypothetical protein
MQEVLERKKEKVSVVMDYMVTIKIKKIND